MKKFIIFSIFLFSLPSFAACPIEGGETVCSLPGFREQVSPIYEPGSGLTEFSGSPEARLKPLNRPEIKPAINNDVPSGSDLNYNSSCQFGVCLQNRSTPLFEQPKQ